MKPEKTIRRRDLLGMGIAGALYAGLAPWTRSRAGDDGVPSGASDTSKSDRPTKQNTGSEGATMTPMNAPVRLRCEYLENPLGIDVPQPSLSWWLSDPRRGARQTAFRILAAGSRDKLDRDESDLWDSGKVASDRSHLVPYGGRTLASRQRAWWKVMVWDQEGRAGGWSAPAFWEMGLLEPNDWRAIWIGLDESAPPPEPWFPGAQWIWFPEGDPRRAAADGPSLFRHAFDLPGGKRPARARLRLLADSRCEAFVNGRPAGRGGAANTFNNWKRPEPLDVTGLLAPGRNVLAVAAANDGGIEFNGDLEAGDAPNPAGLIGFLKVDYADGMSVSVVTGGDWRAVREAPADWTTPAFDDAAWPRAMELGAFGVAPWNKITPDEYTRLPARMLRREFSLGRPVRSARAYVCGLGFFELYLNGSKVGDHVMDPILADYSRKAPYVTFDVTDLLRPGANAAGLLLGNGRFFAPRVKTPTVFRTFGYPKAIAQIEVEYADGARETIATGDGWRVTADGPIRANNEYDGEIYDARMTRDGWSAPGFDDRAWRPAPAVAPPGGRLAAQAVEPMRVTETLRPAAVTNPAPGVYVVDMGRYFYGTVRMRARGPAGATIRLRTAESLEPDGTVKKANSRSALMTDVVILRGGGGETWQATFTGQGGRYVEVTGYPSAPTADDFAGLPGPRPSP
ncbi:MAG: family 78 glycoside hydrolase catalytic domain, partial [bacterium]|nr:family 78 glycoside hydrolase catalytic domain [bacterium]